MKHYILMSTLSISLLFIACTDVEPTLPKKEIKESNISPPCHSDKLAPLMVCGDYIMVKGKINSSNNLDRLNRGTMYMSTYLTEKENKDVIDKEVLLSGKCSFEVIMGIQNPNGTSGGSAVMVYLNDAKLIQILDGKQIEKDHMLQVCKNLKTINSKKKGE